MLLLFFLFLGDKENLEKVKNQLKVTNIMVTTKSKKLKQLNLNPLSVAKFFYEKGLEDYGLIQNFLYLTYLEVLKDGYLLFEEE